MVEYSSEERNMIDDSIAFYRSKVLPDYQLDHNDPDTILKACKYAHDKGSPIIKNSHQHDVWKSIRRKNGETVEDNIDRQKRLAQERYEKRHNIIKAVKKAELEEIREEEKKKEKELEDLTLELEKVQKEDAGIVKAVAEAEKKTLEVEQQIADKDMEIERLKAELAKTKQERQQAENMKNLEAAAMELAKEEEAKIMSETILDEVEQKVQEKKETEDSYIEDLMKEINQPE